ncbi:hypothetical protein TWF281_004378 [Arthrobotrys megalospora]
MSAIAWRALFIFGIISSSHPFKIEFGYGTKDGKFELLQAAAVFSPTDEYCHEITNTLAPDEEVDFIRVQSNSPDDGEPADLVAFYASAEACRESGPMFISWFRRNYRLTQVAAPYWTILHLGGLEGDYTLGKTGYPQPRAWKNVFRPGISPEIGIVRLTRMKPGDTAMLFDEGWAVDPGGVIWEQTDDLDGETSRSGLLQDLDVNRIPQKNPSFQTKEADGTEIFLYPDGTGKILVPDGPVVDVRADGTSVARHEGPDGFIAEFNPRTGALIQDSLGRHLRLNPQELEDIEALDEAGVFKSREKFNQLMNELQSSLLSPNADGYDALQLNGDFVADLGNPLEQGEEQQRSRGFLPKAAKILKKIGSGLKGAYSWLRGSCKLRAKTSSPVLPRCTETDFFKENDFGPSSVRSPPADSSFDKESVPARRISRFQQDGNRVNRNGGEAIEASFGPGDQVIEEILESPYFSHNGNDFTFQEREDSRSSGGNVIQEPDEVKEYQNQNGDHPINMLNILNRAKGTSEFTFKGDIQTLGDIYEEDLEASLPDDEEN